MRPRSLAPAAVAAVALSAALAATPAQARLTPAATAAGVTTILATHTGTLELALYSDARISTRYLGNPDVRIFGPGRLLGATLSRADGSSDGFTAYRLPAFAGGKTETSVYYPTSCYDAPNATVPLSSHCTAPPAMAVLHQGYYTLQILTDGAPVRITLVLHGLSGATTLRPTQVLASAEALLPVRQSIPGKLITWGAALTVTRPSSLLMVSVAHITGIPHAVTTSSCILTGSTAANPPPFGYGPTCSGNSGGGVILNPLGANPGGGNWGIGSGWNGPYTGTVGQGGSLGADSGVRFVGAIGVWLANS
ncbi:MAG TPA: hypothetical protein VNE21_03900 [Mycobacteriales bacterium]|nr:hypothetical protein [Mycobacteriales bacterium]